MGINTTTGGGNGGKRGNGADHGTKPPAAEGSLLDSCVEPLTSSVDVQVIEAPTASPAADRKAPVVQLYPAGTPSATPDESKPYALRVVGAQGALTATYATFDEALEAFVYRTEPSASLTYFSEGATSTLAWMEFTNDGADAVEQYASEQVRQAFLKAKQKRAAYHAAAAPAPTQPGVAGEPPAPMAPALPVASNAVIEQYQRILSAYNYKSGIYRGMFNVKVLEDLGSEIVFHRTSEEATQACVALAIKKGWTAVEIGGTPERKERAWLAYTMAGIKVTNYTPPLHLIERYEAMTGGRVASANVDRPAAEPAATPDSELPGATPARRMRAGG